MQARDVRHRDDASDASCAQQQDHRSQADEDMSSSEEEENQDALNDDDDDEELAGLPDNADVPNADVFGVLLNALGGNQPNNHPPNHAAIARLIGLGMSVRSVGVGAPGAHRRLAALCGFFGFPINFAPSFASRFAFAATRR